MARSTNHARPAPKGIASVRKVPPQRAASPPTADAAIAGFIRVLERIDAAQATSQARQNKAIRRAPEGQ